MHSNFDYIKIDRNTIFLRSSLDFFLIVIKNKKIIKGGKFRF